MKINKLLLAATTFFVTLTGSAAPLNLTDEPLFLNQSVPPALAVTMDSSGSMGLGFMPDAIAGWGNYLNNRVAIASSDFNTIYYNPAVVYRPPLNFDGTPFPNSNFNDARRNGYYRYDQEPVAVDANRWLTGRTDLGSQYRMFWRVLSDYADGTTFSNVNEYADPENNPATNGQAQPQRAFYFTWNGPTNATFWTRRNAGEGTGPNRYTKRVVTSAEEQNFANWYTYYNTREKLVKASISHAFADFGPDFKINWQSFSSWFEEPYNMSLFENTHREDFYDWLFNVETNNGTPLRRAVREAGEMFEEDGGGTSNPYYDANFMGELACQQNFHIAMSDGGWNSTRGVDTNEDNVSQTLPALANGDVVEYRPNNWPMRMYAGDDDETLADTAFRYWHEDLRDDLDNEVPTYIEDYTSSNGTTVVVPLGKQWWELPELFWNPSNDPASWQHMVNYNIGVGLTGALNPETDLMAIRDGTLAWTDVDSTGGKVDDVWHASLNSRGKFFGANDPEQLASALSNVVSNIITRRGRASAGSVSSSVLSASSLSFRSGFDTSNWTGFVVASTINNDGTFGAVQWDASCLLTGGSCTSTGLFETVRDPTTRNIFTYSNGAKHGFSSSLPSSLSGDLLDVSFLQDILASNPSSFTPIDVVNYLRGDRTQEQQNGGQFRNRVSILGDVINSTAKLVRGPNASYSDHKWVEGTAEQINFSSNPNNGYDYFRQQNKNRENILLVGANDGMLHAFGAGLINSASGGKEHWAYIPSQSIEKIGELLDPSYQHASYVDTAPVVKDSYLCSGLTCSWSTVAVGGMRNGGKLFYALDLGGDTTQEPDVLWEFTDDDDPDMGFTYSAATISRVFNPSTKESKWVAFLPNGYNSTNQKAVMYAVDLKTGTLLHKWTNNIGSLSNPNGMGTAVAADYISYTSNGGTSYASDQATDFVYAGDLHGNIYKFDVLDIFSGGAVSSAEILFDGSPDQPITTALSLFTPDDTTQDIIITFGTGKYIELEDRSIVSTPTQYIAGIRDNKDSTFSYSGFSDSKLVSQEITSQSSGFRKISSNPVNSMQGWKLELKDQGERMVSQMSRNNQLKHLSLITIIPKGVDPCLPGGESWFMSLNAKTGGALETPILNNGNSDGVLINGLALGFNSLTSLNGNVGIGIIDTSGGGGSGNGSATQISLKKSKHGRRSWHRIILD